MWLATKKQLIIKLIDTIKERKNSSICLFYFLTLFWNIFKPNYQNIFTFFPEKSKGILKILWGKTRYLSPNKSLKLLNSLFEKFRIYFDSIFTIL